MVLGIIAFIVTLLVLVLVHEWGHFAAARWFGITVEEFGFGFPPAAVKRKWGNTVYSFNLIPLGGFVRIKGEERGDTAPDSFAVQPVHRRAFVIAAGVIMNAVLASLLFAIGLGIGLPQDITESRPAGATITDVKHHIVGVLDDGPAASVIEPGDILRTLDGQAFTSLEEVQNYVRKHADTEINVVVQRKETVHNLTLQPVTLAFENEQEVIGFGVQLATSGTVQYPWYRAPFEGVRMSMHMVSLMVTTLYDAVRSIGGSSSSGFDIAGPVGIAVVASQVVDLGPLFFLQFVALLSINLAFINLLPIPALDGGRLLFLVIEALRGRPVSQDFEAKLHRYGFSVLLALVFVVTVIDISRLSGRVGAWFASF